MSTIFYLFIRITVVNHFVCCVYVTENYHMPTTNTNQHDDYERGTPPGKSCSVGSKLINMEPLGIIQVVNLSTCPLLKSRFQVVEISSLRDFVKTCMNIVEGMYQKIQVFLSPVVQKLKKGNAIQWINPLSSG